MSLVRFITSLVQLVLFIPAVLGIAYIVADLKYQRKTKTGFYQE